MKLYGPAALVEELADEIEGGFEPSLKERRRLFESKERRRWERLNDSRRRKAGKRNKARRDASIRF